MAAAAPRIRFDILGVDRASPALRAVGRGVRVLARGVAGVTVSLARAARSLALPSLLTSTALGTSLVMLNQATVRSVQLAKAVGVSTDTIESLGGAIASAGFEVDNVVDLLEEMNNKLGESRGLKITSSTQDALKILGIKFREIKKLTPEQQFVKISDSILKMTDAQKAASAADILFGGEGNKIFGVLRQSGQSIQEIIASYKALNFQTAESRKGAQAFALQWRNIVTSVKTAGQFVAGIVGQVVAPELVKLNAYLTENRGAFRQWATDLVAKIPGAFRAVRAAYAEFGKWWWKNGDQVIANSVKVAGAIVMIADAVLKVVDYAGKLAPFFNSLASLTRYTPIGAIYRQALSTPEPSVFRPSAPIVDTTRSNYVTPAGKAPEAKVTLDFRGMPDWMSVNQNPKGPVKINLNQGFAY